MKIQPSVSRWRKQKQRQRKLQQQNRRKQRIRRQIPPIRADIPIPVPASCSLPTQRNSPIWPSAYAGGTVTAAGDGTVVAAGSDEIYQHIIEVAHESGYKTRYLCHQSAEISVEEGSAVQAGDILLTITTDETQLDYQVIYEDAPIDPLSVIDARG